MITPILATLLILLTPIDCHCWETSVVSIKDGDTITVSSNINEKEKVKIRLYGIDAPELNQEYGVASRYCLKTLIKNKAINIVSYGYDRYNRTLAIIYDTDGNNINRTMVANGCAWVYTKYCKLPECKDWIKDERVALRAKRGLWDNPDVVAPWVWRKKKKDKNNQWGQNRR